MKKIFSKVVGFFKKLFRLNDDEVEEETETIEEIDVAYPEFNISDLLDSIYKNPEELKKLPYEYLYGERAEYYNQLFYVLDNRWHQIQIDLLLGFVTKEDYDKRVEDFNRIFGFYKNQCLLELEVL